MAAETFTVQDITDFLGRFCSLQRAPAGTRVERFKADFLRLAAGVQGMQRMRSEVERSTAPRHNVFRMLGVEADEDRLHTPFLADILNPEGRHGQGFLFLLAFLAQCGTRASFTRPHGDITQFPWFIETQKHTTHGVLDLVVACPRLRYLLVVENKVRAGEQEDQLHRYSKWLDSQKSYYDTRVLVFLTPRGSDAVSSQGCSYLPLSYRGDIAAILERALAHARAASVLATINQYLTIIRAV